LGVEYSLGISDGECKVHLLISPSFIPSGHKRTFRNEEIPLISSFVNPELKNTRLERDSSRLNMAYSVKLIPLKTLCGIGEY